VRQVLPRVQFSGLISNGDKSVVMVATGIEPDAEFAVKGPFLKIGAGKVLASGQPGVPTLAVMLGEGLARSLKAGPGTSLTLMASTTEGALNAVDVVVAGTFSTGVPELDKRQVYTDLATAQKLLVTPRISSLGVFLDRMESTGPAQQRLAASLPGLQVQTWVDPRGLRGVMRALHHGADQTHVAEHPPRRGCRRRCDALARRAAWRRPTPPIRPPAGIACRRARCARRSRRRPG
jgi:ABC-type lipoprotein release transport system permease subunit